MNQILRRYYRLSKEEVTLRHIGLMLLFKHRLLHTQLVLALRNHLQLVFDLLEFLLITNLAFHELYLRVLHRARLGGAIFFELARG